MQNRIVAVVAVAALAVSLADAQAQAPTNSELRELIVERVGSLDALKVPTTDADLPQPDDPRFTITDDKKRLGKLMFFDPVRANNVRPEFGGNRSLAQSASCGSCHMGEMASKAGLVTSIGMGGEGRGQINPDTGRFEARRNVIEGMTDALPTQVDVFDALRAFTMTGRFDEVDAPFRVSPSIIGFAFNQRLFWSGTAGEAYEPEDPSKANVNPKGLPTAENCVDVTFMAHRMSETQRFALQNIPAYVQLFRRAFPEEAALADQSDNLDDLINDDTVGRAIAAFLRSVITRDTPFDRFLAGDDAALTDTQRRGAQLFFSAATEGGANCVACHSGPALNKVLGDEAGTLIDENFHNLGLNDHPMVELAQTSLNDPDFHDPGRAEATGNDDHRFQFKTPTMRQLRDAAPFMHSGEFTTLREVVAYFNAGEPAAAFSGGHGNLSELFTNPRGNDQVGLGLSDDDVDALVEFLENGLYDPAFVTFDAESPTATFNLNARDLSFDFELAFLGAQNGRVPSLMQHPQTDSETTADLAADTTMADVCGNFGLFGLMATMAPMLIVRHRRRRR